MKADVGEISRFARRAVSDLIEGDGETYFYSLGYAPVGEPDEGKEEKFAIVVGWADVAGKEYPEISIKLAYNEGSDQSDYELDWRIPSSKAMRHGDFEEVGIEDYSPAKIRKTVSRLLDSFGEYNDEKDLELIHSETAKMEDRPSSLPSRRRT